MGSSIKISRDLLLPELEFSTSRSSGPGGQHANKVETRVQVYFNVKASKALSESQIQTILKKRSNQLTKEGVLVLSCEEKKSQIKNKEIVLKKLFSWLERALEKPKKRKKTQPSKAAKMERLSAKKKHSDKKSLRRKINGPE